MAKIPLRTYNREIERMIDQGQSSEAVVHCQHILKYYPKHIDTYRLLGKAYLEMQRYAEASDVLQRVLSTVPDDFISQIGLSIIREDEGNLDAAIWHMEKAFEAQPSNVAVQDELRRLYGRRDGVEPPKIRLTRGALVRMYARGELYQQAIAEIRVALAEDPQRIDLEVILARMYFLSGQPVPATEVCSRLIAKLPYCFEANRILAEILPTTSRAEDAALYQKRIEAMDPYLAYMPPNAVSSAEVPDNAVMVDRLEYIPGEEPTGLPEWTKSVGVEWAEEKEALPDWFSTLKPEEEKSADEQSPPLEDMPAEEGSHPSEPEFAAPSPWDEEPVIPGETESQEEIPDWMRAAGWTPSSGEAETAEADQHYEQEEEETEIEPAEMPDWLAGIAPQDQEEAGLPGQEALTGVTEEEDASSEPAGFEPALEEDLASAEEALDLDELSSLEPDLPDAVLLDENEIPDWLSPGEPPEGDGPVEVASEEVEESRAEESPLQEPAALEEEAGGIPQDQLEIDEAVSWLEGLAARQGADAETLTTAPEERGDLPPEWVQKFSIQAVEGEESEKIAEEKPFLEDAETDTDSTPEPADTYAGQEPIQEGEQIEGVFEEDLFEPLSEEETEQLEVQVEETNEEIIASEVSIHTEEPSEGEEPLVEPSWVEAALMSPGISGDTSDEGINAEVETPPAEPVPFEESVDEFSQQLPGLEAEPEEILAEETAEVVDGLNEMDLEESASAPAPFEADLPDWLLEAKDEILEDTQPVRVSRATQEAETLKEQVGWTPEEEPLEDQPPVSGLAEEEEVPDWLKEELEFPEDESIPEMGVSHEEESETRPEAEVTTPPSEEEPAAEEAPDLVTVISAGESEREPEIDQPVPEEAVATAEIDEDAAFAWLEGLAARQGADEETLLVPPEEREENPPEWVSQQAQIEAESESERTPPVVEPAQAEAAPETSEDTAFPQGALEPEAELPELVPSIEALVQAGKEEAESQEDQGAQEEPVPDWLKGFEKSSDESAGEQITEEPPVWLRDLEAQPEEFPQQKVDSEWVPEFETPAATIAEPARSAPESPAMDVFTQPGEILKAAQAAMEAYNVERALEYYNHLIQNGEHLEEIIHDLRDALYRYPIDIAIWQSLGDAYMRSNRLQEALEAYTKAEELLR